MPLNPKGLAYWFLRYHDIRDILGLKPLTSILGPVLAQWYKQLMQSFKIPTKKKAPKF